VIRRVLRRLVRAYEKSLGTELPYLDDVVTHRPGALLPLSALAVGGRFGRRMPTDTLHMVRIGATWAHDCGACVQIAVDFAVADGLSPSAIENALEGRDELLSPGMRSAFRFGEAVALGRDGESEREFIRAEWGRAALVEASVAAAYAVTFPILKRGMGHARACDVGQLRMSK